jgi:ABC-type transport system substrate-binding protein
VEAEIKVYEAGAFQEAMRKPLHTPFLNNWGGNVPSADPFFSMNPLFHSSNVGPTNRAFYKDPESDALLDKGVEFADPAERKPVYKELWNRLNDARPHIWLLTPLNIYGKAKNLKGVEYAPTLLNYFSDAYFE